MSEIKQKDLIRIIKDNKKNKSDTRFVFLLGAGSSVQSGIPSANSLAKDWIEDIKDDLDEDYQSWKNENNIDEKDLASSYTTIYNKRFEHNPKNGYETLQKLMENKQPSIGYTILSQILENTKHNFVITTNFDSLIEDALFLFTSKRPLVCGHESLADFIQLNSTRPTIIKVHRDILLNPKNTPDNTSEMEEPLEKALKPILENSPTIVIGYGGHDESIMKLLKNTNREPVYWCTRDTSSISEKIEKVLNDRDKIVKIDGFDELMVALHADVYEFESIKSLASNEANESLIVKNAQNKFQIYKKELEKFMQEVKSSTSKEFKENSKTILPYWWDYQVRVDSEDDIDKKEQIFLEGIKDLPKAHQLLGNYASFLHTIKKDYNGNYAIFLEDIKKDYDKAEEYYKKALELDPNSANNNGNYAIFLHTIKKDYDKAEEYYKKALELDPNDADYNGNYASFLHTIKKDYDKAEEYYKKALELDPNDADYNGNYASFLLITDRKEEAIKYMNISFELSTEEKDLQTELWFYKLAHFEDEYLDAKKNLDALLGNGYKSENWDFTLNIKQAIKDNHKHIDELKEYAKKISGLDYSDVV